MEWSGSFKEKIQLKVDRINSLFTSNNIDNSVITLDFTFFFPEQEQSESNGWNVIIYQYAPHEYVAILRKLYEVDDNQFAKFNDKTKVVRDLNDTEIFVQQAVFQPPQNHKNQTLNSTNFTPEEWHEDLIKEKFGGASIVVSKEYKKENYYIQAGVYLILAKKFGHFPNETCETGNNSIELISDVNSKNIVKEIWILLEDLLFDEMFEIIVGKFQKIVSEREQVKSKTMFSLTTHSLKTHLNTTVIKEKNAFLDKLKNYDELKEDFEKYLGKEVDTLFRLTEILSLVDKIYDKQKFIDTAKETTLLSESIVIYDLEDHLRQFNRRKNIERKEPDIKICSTANLESFTLPINIYGLYLGEFLIELFFNTIFENIVVYGKLESGYKNLSIEIKENQIIFSNKTLDKTIQLDETKITGNYGLFKKLLEDTSSGKLSIPSVTDYEFKTIISYEK